MDYIRISPRIFWRGQKEEIILTIKHNTMKDSIKKEFKKAMPVPGAGLSLFEIEDPHTPDEYHVFHIAMSENYLFVGGMANCGFLYSAHMELDHDFSLDENLQELYDAIYYKLLEGEDVSGELF